MRKQQQYDLDTVFDFGKHEGEALLDVIEKDPAYVSWLLDNVSDFSMCIMAENLYRSRADDQEEEEMEQEEHFWGDTAEIF